MEITQNNFDEFTKEGVVLVDFWAEWCGPCQSMMPVFDQFEKESDVKVGKVNVDKEGDLAGKYRVMSIPTIIVFKDGKMVDQVVGAQSVEALKELADKHK